MWMNRKRIQAVSQHGNIRKSGVDGVGVGVNTEV